MVFDIKVRLYEENGTEFIGLNSSNGFNATTSVQEAPQTLREILSEIIRQEARNLESKAESLAPRAPAPVK